MYAGALASVVESYKQVFQKAGVELVLIGVDLVAAGRALLSLDEPCAGTIIADIGDTVTSIGIFDDKRRLLFSTSVLYGGSTATRKIMDEKKIDQAAAERLKRAYGLDMADPNNPVASMLESGFEKVIAEIKKTMGYYARQTDKLIENIVLSGGSSLIPGIELFLSKKIGIPVIRKNPLLCLKGAEQIEQTCIFYVNVVGLALRVAGDASEGINLLKAKKQLVPQNRQGAFFKKIGSFFRGFKNKTSQV